MYSNLKPPTDPQPPPEGFYTYVPEPKAVLAQVAHGAVQAAVEARRKRILEQEISRATAMVTDSSDTNSRSESVAQLVPRVASAVRKDDEVVLDEQGDDGLGAITNRRLRRPVSVRILILNLLQL